MKYAIAHGLRHLNLSTGMDVSKSRWAPVETRYREVEFSPQSCMNILKHRSYRTILRSVKAKPSSTWLSRTFRRGAG
jgi:hypothetical protein